MKTPRIAVVYRRLSKGNLLKQKSLEDQLKEIEDYAAHNGFEIATVYTDAVRTGRTLERRDQMQQLLKDAESGHLERLGVSHVIFWGIDRLARNLRDSLNFEHAMARAGLHLVGVREHFEHDGSRLSRLRFTLEAFIAESYSDNMTALSRRGQRPKMLEGGYSSPSTPYGFRRTTGNGPLAIHLPEAELVKEMYDRLLRGESISAIARDLTSRRVPKRNGSWKWSPIEVSRRLREDANIGIRTYKGVAWDGRRALPNGDPRAWEIIPSAHQAIIDLDTFIRAQHLLEDRRRSRNLSVTRKHFALLSGLGLLVCGKCGSCYVSNVARGYRMRDGRRVPMLERRYMCSRRVRLRDCTGQLVRQWTLDGVVLEQIARYVAEPGVVQRVWKQHLKRGLEALMPVKSQLRAKEAEIAEWAGRQSRLIDAYGSAPMPVEVFGREIKRLEERLRVLRSERAALLKRVAAFDGKVSPEAILGSLKNFHESFGAAAPETRKLLVRGLIKKVTINGPRDYLIETTFLPAPVAFPFGQDSEPAPAPQAGQGQATPL